jgi:hypothetical protein
MRRLRSKLTFANVTSCLALFVALGGSSYAALKLPAGSVGTPQIQKSAVTAAKIKEEAINAVKIQKEAITGSKIKDDSITQNDISGSAVGTPGPPGPPGPPGAPGSVSTELRTNSVDFSTQTPKELTVNCPNGPVLGGGAILHPVADSQQHHMSVVRSYAVDSNTWLVRGVSDDESVSWEMTGDAICAK